MKKKTKKPASKAQSTTKAKKSVAKKISSKELKDIKGGSWRASGPPRHSAW